MSQPTVNVPSGTVPATHSHPTYGYCVIVHRHPEGLATTIRTSNGTAIVPNKSLSTVKQEKS
jgi:hypothetical protein